MEKKLISKLKNSKLWVSLAMIWSFIVYNPVLIFASNEIFSKANSTIKELGVELMKLSTGAMVVIVIITTLMSMFSSNERSVSNALTWRKRAVVAWVLISCLGWLVAYGEDLFQGGSYDFAMIEQAITIFM